MGVNKVIYEATVLIDLTDDTISPEFLKHGITAHDKTGAVITGTSNDFPMDPIEYDYNIGYISAGSWIYENPTQTYTDIYVVEEGKTYFITLGANVGTRFRAMFTTTDVTTLTSGRVTGTQIINLNNPTAYKNVTYTAPSDGYVLIAKDNIGKSGIKTYVYDIASSWL